MGSSTSGILPILLMDKLDNIPLSSQQFISPYKRYVDEIFLQITEAGAAKEFHKWTAYTYDYKFGIEKPTKSADGISLSLGPKTGTVPSIFTKSQKIYSFVHYQSVLRRYHTINFIRNECRRIQQRCSAQTTLQNRDRTWDEILRFNRYPENKVDETKNLRKQRAFYIPNKEGSYDSVRLRTTEPQNLSKGRPTSTRRLEFLHTKASTLQIYNGTQMHQSQLCAIPNSNSCLRRNTVYQIIICSSYKQFFIGSTIQFIHTNSSVPSTSECFSRQLTTVAWASKSIESTRIN